jgi:hypothetical protein
MSCRLGFDPFGADEAALREHAEACEACADVLRVRVGSRAAWRAGLARDEARAVFRERRLGRARPPARAAATSFALVFAVAALSGYALARRGVGAHADAPAAVTSPRAADARPAPAPSAMPSSRMPSVVLASSAAPAPSTPAETEPRRAAAATAAVAAESPRELWERAIALLEAGDRAGAERAFRRVADAPGVDGGLRGRATFRWAQLLLARGDTLTPRDALRRLVRGRDAALGLDAALLLERCAPDERAETWDAYLERTTDPSLRERALRHRDGG